MDSKKNSDLELLSCRVFTESGQPAVADLADQRKSRQGKIWMPQCMSNFRDRLIMASNRTRFWLNRQDIILLVYVGQKKNA